MAALDLGIGGGSGNGRRVTADALIARGDQSGNIEQCDEWTERAGRGEVARLPGRVELALENAQSLEVVDRVAVAPDQGADPVPARRQRRALDAGERCHAQAECAIAQFLEGEQQL